MVLYNKTMRNNNQNDHQHLPPNLHETFYIVLLSILPLFICNLKHSYIYQLGEKIFKIGHIIY